MQEKIGKKLEVYSLSEIPETSENQKYFACIGGRKNFECILESKELSRAEFMKKYLYQIDPCHLPIYEDQDILIRQDAQIAIPGFYIVATKNNYRKISEIDLELYQKCLYFVALLRKKLLESFDIQRAFMYYDEHYKKPSSTHFWVMPIYEDVLFKHNLHPTILTSEVWHYQDLFEFQHTKEDIYRINDGMKRILRKEKI